MLDIDLAMALLLKPDQPIHFSDQGRPLRWLRDNRDSYLDDADPRSLSDGVLHATADDEWRRALVGQAVRRVMGAMRDWAPLLCQTRDGTGVLARVGRLRNLLLDLASSLDPRTYDERAAVAGVLAIRSECSILALGLELGSNVPSHRVRRGVCLAPFPLLGATQKTLERQLALAASGDIRRLRSELAGR